MCFSMLCMCVYVRTEQDEGLEALSQALRRQKQMGIAIGQEADSQIGGLCLSLTNAGFSLHHSHPSCHTPGLIDSISDRTEHVASRVERQTERVSKMRERAGLCSE